jgi:hypothetical protein
MSDSPSSASPSLPDVPPPLPHKVLLFKVGCWLGFSFPIIQIAGLLVLSFLPGPPLPQSLFVLIAAGVIEAYSALSVLRHRKGSRGIFTGASIVFAFIYLTWGGFIFAILNLIPLLLLVASSSPDVAPKAQESDSLETGGVASSTESSSPKEDLY